MKHIERALHFAMNGLCGALSANLADETAVFLHDVYEQHRIDGRSAARALSSCAIHLVSAFGADWWLRFASRPVTVSSDGTITSGRGSFVRYLGQAALGASFAGLSWLAGHAGLSRHPELLNTSTKLWLFIALASAFAMVCRTAFKRGEYFPLAIFYAAGKGVVVSMSVLMAVGLGLFSVGIDISSMSFFDASMIALGAAGCILNVYAKYLSPDCAIVE